MLRRAQGRRPLHRRMLVLTLMVSVLIGSPGITASATPSGSRVIGSVPLDDRTVELQVHSESMNRTVQVVVHRAADIGRPAPTLYLLNGAAGGHDGSSWFERTDVREFLQDKQVNVVVPMGGEASYYTDWQRPDPVLGVNKWSTFLARELPPLMDAMFDGSGAAAVAGISMAGTSVLQLAIANPGVYTAVASYSGCAMTSDPAGRLFVKSVVELRGHGNADNMWGPDTDPAWVANDPYVNAEKLRGLGIYISAGSGLPGQFDRLDGPGIDGNPRRLVEQLAVGAVIEKVTDYCSDKLRSRLAELEIPAQYNFAATGTHSWAYWEQDFHDSWPLLAEKMGVAA